MKKTRVTIDMSELQYTTLERAEWLTDAESKAEVIRRAIRLYTFLTAAAAQGRKLYLEDESGKLERIAMVELDVARGATTDPK